MPVPVVICDDSGFARKQMARALPSEWDVSVTLTASGKEAIEAIQAGKGDILFVDLTMPEMDGFDVLAYIQSHDLPTVSIVVSGDIQPESRERAKRLGAIAFIQKPINSEELIRVLRDYGVLDTLIPRKDPQIVVPPASRPEPGPIDFRDWCQEIANVAMGRAGELLAKAFGTDVVLSIPRVCVLDWPEVKALLAAFHSESVSLVSQGFIGGGIAGETMVLFDGADVAKLANLTASTNAPTPVAELEGLMDISNVLVGAFLKGISEQLDIPFSQGHPFARIHNSGLQRLTLNRSEKAQKALTIEINYTLGVQQLRCDQLLLFPEKTMARLKAQKALTEVA